MTEHIVHSYADSENGLFTSECIVGELPLSVGVEIIFHFDFGDDWRFLIVVEPFSDEDSSLLKPKVIEKRGNPPEQYPDSDWDY